MITHGGDVFEVACELGISTTEILDFSANINPRGLPERARERLRRDAADFHQLSLYPDPSARSLREALSAKLDIDPDAIVVGPGAEALLAPIMRAIGRGKVLFPIPAFSEYRRVCRQTDGCAVSFELNRADDFRLPVDEFCACLRNIHPAVAIVNNPHNPSGAALSANEAAQILATASSIGCTLLLDEAFIDFAPEASLLREAARQSHLIALRSLTKFYGCPALRIGYAVAHPTIARAVRSAMPAWPVTQLAIDTLAEAVTDRAFAAATVAENVERCACLKSSLEALGLYVFPSAANYLLIELPDGAPAASDLRRRLVTGHHILIRNCDSYENMKPGRFIRVAVRSQPDNRRLVSALRAELERT